LKIGFIVTFLSHGNPGSIVRIQEISKYLYKSKVSTTILTPYAEDIVNLSDNDVQLIPTTISNIGISSMAYRVASKMGSIRLGSNLLLSNQSIRRMVEVVRKGLQRVLRDTRFDILHAVQPYAALACTSLIKEFNLPLVTDLHNVWPEEAVAESMAEINDKTFNRLRNIEQTIIDSSAAITVVSDFMKSYVVNKYSTANKPVIVVPPAGPILQKRQEIIKENNVIYAGSVHPREHVDLFAYSIPFIKQPASFFISNYGRALSNIKKITKRSGYPPVNYVWFKTRYEVLEFMERSKLAALPSQNDITRQLGPPLKLFDYMACGLPVVANDIGGWSEMIKREQIGILTSDDPKDYAQAVDIIMSDDTLWHKMHSNAMKLIKTKYNWQKVAEDILVPLYTNVLDH
jgi:glycosyltransferase involved in cell wall biosynthesis